MFTVKPMHNALGESKMKSIVDDVGHQIVIVTAEHSTEVAEWLVRLMNAEEPAREAPHDS